LKKEKNLKIQEVLSVFDEKGESVKVGAPYLDKTFCDLWSYCSSKRDKIRVTKFKRKNRYERTYWF
jgi:ribosomal protein L21